MGLTGRGGGARDRNVTLGTVPGADPAVTIGDIMVPLREWLRPPKSLLLILVLLSLVSVSAVGWFGFKLLEQDRMVQAQRRQERLEQAADRIAATLRGTLAETGERLSAWLTTPPPAGKPDDGGLLRGGEDSVAGAPAELVARHALGDDSLREELLRGRWHLTRGQFEFYFGGVAPEDRQALAEAVAQAWNETSARGQTTVWAGGHPFFAMWRTSGG